MASREDDGLLRPHGGYRRLKSFQVAQLVYDVTVRFCDRYVERTSRTRDQMVQAARSGVQNIAEGSQASGTSKKMELKLTNVARASLEELRLDYEDFLRHRGLAEWDRTDGRRQALVDRRCGSAGEVAAWVREVHAGRVGGRSGRGGRSGQGGQGGQGGQDERAAAGRGEDGQDDQSALRQSQRGQDDPTAQRLRQPGQDDQSAQRHSRSEQADQSALSRTDGAVPPSDQSTPSTSSTPSIPPKPTYPEIAANAALILIDVASGLLDRQIASLARSFENEGGFTEQLYRVRTNRRRQANG